jgi:hypothetical protein
MDSQRKILIIPRCDNKTMNSRHCRDHRMLKKMVLLSLHDAGPFPKARRIHWQNLARFGEPFDPPFQLLSLDTILISSSFNSSLQFPKGHRRKEYLLILQLFQPSQDTAVRFGIPQLRNNIGVEQGISRELHGFAAS